IVGDINANQVIIFGKVEGKVEACTLELKNKGILLGDILVETMIFEKGGVFNGNCQMKTPTNVSGNVTKIN
ncbi:MAG: bactofilin family protein, partial [Thermodesulfobacteriota bacterium]